MKITELDFTEGKKYRDLSNGSIWVADGDDLFGESEGYNGLINECYTLKEIIESNFESVEMIFKDVVIRENNPFLCPHCGSDEDAQFISGNGLKGVEKFSCNICSKTYTVLYQPRIYDVLES